VCETGTMEILQTLGRPMQLLSHFSDESGGRSEVTHQSQSVDVVNFNVVHDGPVHPLRQ